MVGGRDSGQKKVSVSIGCFGSIPIDDQQQWWEGKGRIYIHRVGFINLSGRC